MKVNRQWAGMSDMTPDFSPIMGTTPIKGFYLDAGWGTWGFKATPVCGTTMAYTVANDQDHELIRAVQPVAVRELSSWSARRARPRWDTEPPEGVREVGRRVSRTPHRGGRPTEDLGRRQGSPRGVRLASRFSRLPRGVAG